MISVQKITKICKYHLPIDNCIFWHYFGIFEPVFRIEKWHPNEKIKMLDLGKLQICNINYKIFNDINLGIPNHPTNICFNVIKKDQISIMKLCDYRRLFMLLKEFEIIEA